MSILQEYESIRRWIGEEKYQAINRYLDSHPDVLLSDVYYNEEAYKKFEAWWNQEKEGK